MSGVRLRVGVVVLVVGVAAFGVVVVPSLLPGPGESAGPSPLGSAAPTPGQAAFRLIDDAAFTGGRLTSGWATDRLLVAGGQVCQAGGPCHAALWATSDGDEWALTIESALLSDSVVGVAHHAGRWAAVGTDGAWFSDDGLTWVPATADFRNAVTEDERARCASAEGAVHALLVTWQNFVALGEVSCVSRARGAAVWRSSDGTSWERAPYSPALDDGAMLTGALLPDGRLVAAGDGVWTSDDEGRTWERGNAFGDDTIVQLLATEQQVLAVGYPREGLETKLWRSADGVIWDRLPLSGMAPFEPRALTQWHGRTIVAGELAGPDFARRLVVAGIAASGESIALDVEGDANALIDVLIRFKGTILGLGSVRTEQGNHRIAAWASGS